MTTQDTVFLAKPWRTIAKALRDADDLRIIVSAYLGSGADELMHLESGDALYVNASKATIKAGLTDPRVLLKLVKAGIRCFSVARLHAKIYLADGVAFIGSNNASNHSAKVLAEAAARIESPELFAAIIAWIGSLPAIRLDEDAITPLLDLYEPQRHRERRPRKRAATRDDNANSLWITHFEGDYQEMLSDDYDQWEAESEKAVRKATRFVHFQIFFEGNGRSRLYDEVIPGDEVIVVDRGEEGVYGPMRVLNRVHRERVRGKLVRVLALEEDVDQRPIPFRRFRKGLEKAGIAVLPQSGRTERRISAASASQVRLSLTSYAP